MFSAIGNFVRTAVNRQVDTTEDEDEDFNVDQELRILKERQNPSKSSAGGSDGENGGDADEVEQVPPAQHDSGTIKTKNRAVLVPGSAGAKNASTASTNKNAAAGAGAAMANKVGQPDAGDLHSTTKVKKRSRRDQHQVADGAEVAADNVNDEEDVGSSVGENSYRFERTSSGGSGSGFELQYSDPASDAPAGAEQLRRLHLNTSTTASSSGNDSDGGAGDRVEVTTMTSERALGAQEVLMMSSPPNTPDVDVGEQLTLSDLVMESEFSTVKKKKRKADQHANTNGTTPTGAAAASTTSQVVGGGATTSGWSKVPSAAEQNKLQMNKAALLNKKPLAKPKKYTSDYLLQTQKRVEGEVVHVVDAGAFVVVSEEMFHGVLAQRKRFQTAHKHGFVTLTSKLSFVLARNPEPKAHKDKQYIAEDIAIVVDDELPSVEEGAGAQPPSTSVGGSERDVATAPKPSGKPPGSASSPQETGTRTGSGTAASTTTASPAVLAASRMTTAELIASHLGPHKMASLLPAAGGKGGVTAKRKEELVRTQQRITGSVVHGEEHYCLITSELMAGKILGPTKKLVSETGFPLANGVQRWERGQVVEFQVCRNPILKDDPETQFLACNIDILVDGKSSQSLPAGGAGGGDQLRGFSQTQPPDPSYSSGTAQPFDVSFKERQSFKTADSYPTSTYLEGAATGIAEIPGSADAFGSSSGQQASMKSLGRPIEPMKPNQTAGAPPATQTTTAPGNYQSATSQSTTRPSWSSGSAISGTTTTTSSTSAIVEQTSTTTSTISSTSIPVKREPLSKLAAGSRRVVGYVVHSKPDYALVQSEAFHGQVLAPTRKVRSSFPKGGKWVANMELEFRIMQNPVGHASDKRYLATDIVLLQAEAEDIRLKKPMHAEHWKQKKRVRGEVLLAYDQYGIVLCDFSRGGPILAHRNRFAKEHKYEEIYVGMELDFCIVRNPHLDQNPESKDEWLCDDVRACYPSEDAPPITTPSTNFSLKEFLDTSSSTHAAGDYSKYNYTTSAMNKVDPNAGRLVVKDDDFSRRRVLIDDMDVVRVSVANVTPNGSTLKVEYPRVQSMNLQPYLPKAECGTVKLKQGQIAYVKLGYPLDAKKKRLLAYDLRLSMPAGWQEVDEEVEDADKGASPARRSKKLRGRGEPGGAGVGSSSAPSSSQEETDASESEMNSTTRPTGGVEGVPAPPTELREDVKPLPAAPPPPPTNAAPPPPTNAAPPPPSVAAPDEQRVGSGPSNMIISPILLNKPAPPAAVKAPPGLADVVFDEAPPGVAAAVVDHGDEEPSLLNSLMGGVNMPVFEDDGDQYQIGATEGAGQNQNQNQRKQTVSLLSVLMGEAATGQEVVDEGGASKTQIVPPPDAGPPPAPVEGETSGSTMGILMGTSTSTASISCGGPVGSGGFLEDVGRIVHLVNSSESNFGVAEMELPTSSACEKEYLLFNNASCLQLGVGDRIKLKPCSGQDEATTLTLSSSANASSSEEEGDHLKVVGGAAPPPAGAGSCGGQNDTEGDSRVRHKVRMGEVLGAVKMCSGGEGDRDHETAVVPIPQHSLLYKLAHRLEETEIRTRIGLFEKKTPSGGGAAAATAVNLNSPMSASVCSALEEFWAEHAEAFYGEQTEPDDVFADMSESNTETIVKQALKIQEKDAKLFRDVTALIFIPLDRNFGISAPLRLTLQRHPNLLFASPAPCFDVFLYVLESRERMKGLLHEHKNRSFLEMLVSKLNTFGLEDEDQIRQEETLRKRIVDLLLYLET
eukprot:CAMPEP_0178982894 /NCGR_PEP_ID=MMETSP0795-20121207/749_1 /TAXON_ID=88552 /ORGANISM="Amoebophrya sp., Strain Ameob2" /LENGTH=1755 /DNA_ID=CAMNT_0020673589 /DNA_START=197 /DNA_END=5464 /DNA_ORIENTATION=-